MENPYNVCTCEASKLACGHGCLKFVAQTTGVSNRGLHYALETTPWYKYTPTYIRTCTCMYPTSIVHVHQLIPISNYMFGTQINHLYAIDANIGSSKTGVGAYTEVSAYLEYYGSYVPASQTTVPNW